MLGPPWKACCRRAKKPQWMNYTPQPAWWFWGLGWPPLLTIKSSSRRRRKCTLPECLCWVYQQPQCSLTRTLIFMCHSLFKHLMCIWPWTCSLISTWRLWTHGRPPICFKLELEEAFLIKIVILIIFIGHKAVSTWMCNSQQGSSMRSV